MINLNSDKIKIEIHLTMAYGSHVVMRDVNARIKRGSIFVIMGESGAGKSTLLRNMIGLQHPAEGDDEYVAMAEDLVRILVPAAIAVR